MTIDLMAAMRSELPENELDGMKIRRYTVPGNYPGRIRDMLRGRDIPPGTYTGLFEYTGNRLDYGARERGWRVWMSDTPAELSDHLEPLLTASMLKAKRVLINGLGLGCLLKGCLALPSVERVDVVELDPRVIKLVGSAYEGPRVRIIQGNALDSGHFPPGSRWDVAWHDIWPDINQDYKPEYLRLMRMYGHRVRWQSAWMRREVLGR